MKKAIKTKVDLNEICFDEELYPRSQYHWAVAYDYAQSIRAGSVFPPIVLAMYKNKKILVDGKSKYAVRIGVFSSKEEALVVFHKLCTNE